MSAARGVVAGCALALLAVDAGAADLRLVDAVRNRDRQQVAALLEQRVDVNLPAADGATALHWAVHWEDADTVARLIASGANVNASNDLGVTPLALACANGNAAIVGKLLAGGALPNVLSNGEPPLMTAARSGDVDIVTALISRGANVNARDAARGQTPLMWAVAHGHGGVVRVLLDKGADVHARSQAVRQLVMRGSRYGGVISREKAAVDRAVGEVEHGGSTPLLFAARNGSVESTRLLISAGANVNDQAPDGSSALAMASHSGHGAVAAVLLEHGADPNADAGGYSALHAAVLRGDGELVNRLLARGADVNSRLKKGTPSRRYSKDFAFNESWIGATPFWLAARFAETGIMRALAARGADPTATPADGTTALIAAIAAGIDSGPSASDRRERRLDPLELAAKAERRVEEERLTLETVTLALEAGVDVNAANNAGDTALHQATAKGLLAVIRMLAERGAKLDAENKRGATPLRVALGRSRGGSEEPSLQQAAELLRQLGATN